MQSLPARDSTFLDLLVTRRSSILYLRTTNAVVIRRYPPSRCRVPLLLREKFPVYVPYNVRVAVTVIQFNITFFRGGNIIRLCGGEPCSDRVPRHGPMRRCHAVVSLEDVNEGL